LGDKAPTPKLEDGLYAASALRMLTVVNHVPDTVTTLMLISHMPGVQDLAMHLASRDSDHDAYMDAATRYPTSALTVLETEKTWAELDGQDARITKFKVPRAH
jgi:phosphohistidine phosphatase